MRQKAYSTDQEQGRKNKGDSEGEEPRVICRSLTALEIPSSTKSKVHGRTGVDRSGHTIV